jgi:hypothetical protein
MNQTRLNPEYINGQMDSDLKLPEPSKRGASNLKSGFIDHNIRARPSPMFSPIRSTLD